MKKYLSIILSLVLILGTVFAVPVTSVSAEGVTAASFTDGVVWGLSEGGTDYLRLTVGWGAFTGANGSVSIEDAAACRSTMANVGGFTAGKTYQISFSASGISNVYVVLNEASAYFDGNQNVQAEAGYESDLVFGSVQNGTATVIVTPTSDNIYLIVKNSATSVILNNFSVKELTETDIIVESMNNGLTWGLSEGGVDYLRLTAGWGTFTSVGGSVSISDGAACRSTMANVGGFTAGKTYKISFSASGVSNVFAVINYDSAYFDGNQNVQAKSGCESDLVFGSVQNGIATITVTPTSDNIYLIVKNSATSGVLSDFNVKTLTESELAGIAVANGNWAVTQNAGGVVTKSNNAVNITGAQYQQISTALTGLEKNSVYTLTFKHTAGDQWQFANPAFVIPGETVWSSGLNSKEGTVNFENGSCNTADTTTITFTTNNTDTAYLLVFFCNAPTKDGVLGNIVLSQFEFTEVKTYTDAEIAGKAVANGDWAVTQNAGGTVTKSNNAVNITGAQYQQISTALTGLEKNSVYTLTFKHTAGDQWQFANPAFVIPGETVWSSGLNSKEGTVNFENGSCNTADTTTITFTTNNTDTAYLLVFFCNAPTKDGVLGNIVLSQFEFTKVKTYTDAEIAGKAVANGDWAVTQNAGGTVTKSNDTVSITGAQYQVVSLPLTGLENNTTYILKFNHTAGDQWQFANPAYVIPGETVWTSGIESKAGTVSFFDGSCNTADSTTIRFTTNDTDTDYLVAFNCNAPYYNGTLGTVVLSNFSLAKETAYEFVGTAIRAASEETTQGMRFKNTISKELLANGYNGKEIVEYGNIVAYEKNIDTDFVYENVDGKKIKKGVAYNKSAGINVVFAEDDESVTYTAVLVGIKTENYALNCKVRSYMVLSDGSVIYGDIQNYSVYSMFNAILNGNSDADKTVVNNILADEDVNAGYNAWLSENS